MRSPQAAAVNRPAPAFDPLAFATRHAILLLAVACWLLPTVYRLATTLWNTPEQGHGPMILLVVGWLFWQQRQHSATPDRARPFAGTVCLLLAVAAYVLGRSQAILMLEVGSFIPLLAGLMLMTGGVALLRQYWFALLFMLFLIPLPSGVVDALTGVLKNQVSHVAEVLLYQVGYPVARSGVMLSVGQYQLLVADACSGLNSLFSLGALGLLYLYLTAATARRRPLHVGLLLLAIVPIALAANAVRVAALVLITWYFGDAAGQGLAHAGAGFLLFLVALLLLLAVDQMVGGVLTRWPAGGARRSGATRPAPATPGVGS